MSRKQLWGALALILVFSMTLSACGGAATPAPAQPVQPAAATQAPAAPAAPTAAPAQTGLQIPDVVAGKFNIGMVLIGPHDDGGWSQAHYEGLEYIAKNMPDAHIAYVENVPEGTDSEQAFRSLARKGFKLIFGTSFGFGDPMEIVAGEFPDAMFIHLTGFKSNQTNFGNLMGAMENMKYLAGILAGARAKMDGNPKLGYMATFPIPEELRLGNAFMLGAKKTCPECTMDIRWLNTWHDPIIEKESAASLFDAGAQVVLTGADTPAVADVATAKGKWGITYDWAGSCKAERCLTAPYWNWGPVYLNIAKQVQAGTYKAGWEYFDSDTGAPGPVRLHGRPAAHQGRSRAAGRCAANGERHPGQDGEGRIHPLRCLRWRDQGQYRQSDRAGRREDDPGRPGPVPARRRHQQVQVLHEVVGRRHYG